ncbi:MAG: NAD-dependent epimerase [Desulfuromonadales bacterium C00003096]|nr:MAG: NAD-dependent epimerase [Desulfuromonadales bacterium C00003096]
MNVLVTGNMGYIGPCLVQHLRSTYDDINIIGLDMGYFAHCLSNSETFPEHRVDVQYFSDLRRWPSDIISLKDVDAVVHLAAISNDPMGKTFENVTLDVNYKSSIDLAVRAKESGVKTFVFACSCSIYGFAEGGPRTEASDVNPLTAYAKSKVYTERDLEKIADSKFKVTSLRFGTACGMSERLRLDLVLNDFVACAVASGKITILSDGTPWRPLIHVKDMSRAIDWALGRDLSAGGEFLAVNVGSDEWNCQVRDLAEAVAKEIPGVEISIDKDAQPDKRSYKVDFGLYKKLAPDHQPTVGLETAICGLRDGLKAMNFVDRDFRNSSYIRLKVLSDLRDRGLLNDKLEWL